MSRDFKTDPSVNGQKVWHAGNDGPGSGLDAGMVSDHGIGTTARNINGTDLNLLRNSGLYMAHRTTGGVTNGPPQNAGDQTWFYLLHIEHNALWSLQYTWDFNHNTMQSRRSYDAAGVRTWSGWRVIPYLDTVWHPGNDGGGSGLDADLLDGLTSADFASASHTHPDAVAGGASGFMTGSSAAKLETLSAQAIGAFSAHHATDQLNIASATSVKVEYGVEDFDVSGWYDPVASRYTPQRAGYYNLNAAIFIAPGVDAKWVQLQLYKNGAEWGRLAMTHTSSALGLVVSGSSEVHANGTTDYFEVYLIHNFGVNTSDLLAGTAYKFQGVYLGTA